MTATASVSSSLFAPPVLNNLTGENQAASAAFLTWTPSRGQFLLGNRREELSLTAGSERFNEFPESQPNADGGTTAKLIPAAPRATVPSNTTQVASLKLPPAPPREERQSAGESLSSTPSEAEPVSPPLADETQLLADADMAAAASNFDGLEEVDRETTLMQYFTREELAGEYDGTFIADADLPPVSARDNDQPPAVGVIPTTGNPSGPGGKPTLGQTLAGNAENSELGAGVPQFSPWRSAAVFFGLIGMALIGVWLAKRGGNPLRALKDKSLTVIETINLGAQRQIVIVEMNEDALVLGVTAHSINLLTRVPMYELQTGYQGVVNKIIQNESQASEEHWQKRPAFQVGTMATELAPAMATGTYGPYGQGKQRIGEVRRIRQAMRPGSVDLRLKATYPRTEQNAKAELIRRAREQLQALEN